ncbi:MAG: hypothetical protein ABI866_01515 [Dokdonella sp.]
MTKKIQPLPPLVEPSHLTGEWQKTQQTCFWHAETPFSVMGIVEKMTGILLYRDATQDLLTYQGSTTSGGDPRSIRLRHEAVIDSRNLFSLQVESKALKKWNPEERFDTNTNRTFAFWCAKLEIVGDIVWADASQALRDQRHAESIALEEAEASIVEDPVQIAALKRAIVDSLRSGMRAFTVNKEGGTHFSFDGSMFRRCDFGDEPNVDEAYATDEAMLASLHKFFEWDARRPVYPRQPTEVAVWTYILRMLKPRT